MLIDFNFISHVFCYGIGITIINKRSAYEVLTLRVLNSIRTLAAAAIAMRRIAIDFRIDPLQVLLKLELKLELKLRLNLNLLNSRAY